MVDTLEFKRQWYYCNYFALFFFMFTCVFFYGWELLSVRCIDLCISALLLILWLWTAYFHVASHCRNCMCVHVLRCHLVNVIIHITISILQSLICCRFYCHEKSFIKFYFAELHVQLKPWENTKYWGKIPNQLWEHRSARWGQSSCWSADDQCLQFLFLKLTHYRKNCPFTSVSVVNFTCLSVLQQLKVRGPGFGPFVCVCPSPIETSVCRL